MKKWKYILTGLVCLIGLGLISCGSVLPRLMPSDVPKQTREYLATEPNDYGLYFTLYDAEEAFKDVLTLHRDRLLDWEYYLKKEENLYTDAKGYLEPQIAQSRESLGTIIGDENTPFSLAGILTLVGFSGLTGLIGKNMKRGGDYTPEEHDLDVANALEEGRTEPT